MKSNKDPNTVVSVGTKRRKKLTHWKNEPDVDLFLHDENQASILQEEQVKKVRKNYKLINPLNDTDLQERGKSGVSVQHIKRISQFLYSNLAVSILNQPNLFQVNPVSFKDQKAAIQHQQLLNHQFNNKLNKVNFVNNLVRTLVDEGTAFVRVGWRYEEKDEYVETPVYRYTKANDEEAKQIYHELGMALIQGYSQGIDPTKEINMNTGELPDQPQSSGMSVTPQDPNLAQQQATQQAQPQPQAPQAQGQASDDELMNVMGGQLQSAPQDPQAQQPPQQPINPEDLSKPSPQPGMDMGQFTALNMFKSLAQRALENKDDPNYVKPVIPPDMLAPSIAKTERTGIPQVAHDTGKVEITKQRVIAKNEPELELVNVEDIIIDPTCNGDIANAKFIIRKFNTSLSDLKAQEDIYPFLDDLMTKIRNGNEDYFTTPEKTSNYSNTSYKNPYGGTTDQSGSYFSFKDKSRQEVTVHEYWGYYDIDDTGVVQPIVASYVGDVLIRLERSPYPDGELPYVAIKYMPLKNMIYGEALAPLLEDTQQLITATTRGIINIQARSSQGQVIAPKGLFDNQNAIRFRSGEDALYNMVGGARIQDLIYTNNGGEFSQSSLEFLNRQYADSEALSGSRAFTGGIDQGAYGQQSPNSSVGIPNLTSREGDVLYRISQGLEQIGLKIAKMNALFIDNKEVVRLTKNKFIEIDQDALKGDIYLKVELMSPLEAITRGQQLMTLLQTVGPAVDWGITQPLFAILLKLYNFDDAANKILEFQPQPDPKVQAEVQKIQAEAQKIIAEAESKKQDIEFTKARIEYLQAQTNMVRQQFSNEYDGTSAYRNTEVAQAQANAQGRAMMAKEGNKKAQKAIMRDTEHDRPKQILQQNSDGDGSIPSGGAGLRSASPPDAPDGGLHSLETQMSKTT